MILLCIRSIEIGTYLASEGSQSNVNTIGIPLTVVQLSKAGIHQQTLCLAIFSVPWGAGTTGVAAHGVDAVAQWMARFGGGRTLINVTAILRGWQICMHGVNYDINFPRY